MSLKLRICLAVLFFSMPVLAVESEISGSLRADFQEHFGFFEAEGSANSVVDGQRIDEMRFSDETLNVLKERSAFAERSLRKLLDSKVRELLQHSPDFQALEKIEKAVSQVQVEIQEGVSFSGKFQFVDNRIEIEMKNPYCKVRGESKVDGSQEPRILLLVEGNPNQINTQLSYSKIESSLQFEKALNANRRIQLKIEDQHDRGNSVTFSIASSY